MTRKRTIIVGDVHGCRNELAQLLEKAKYEPSTDRVILAGDLVDRGPDSVGTVKYAREHNLEAIQGNHDNKLVRYHKHEHKKKFNRHYRNPMKFSEEKMEIYNGLSEEDHEWLRNLPTCIELWEYNTLVIHAGCKPGTPAEQQHYKTHLFTRFLSTSNHNKLMRLDPVTLEQPKDSIFWAEVYDGTSNIVYGHHVHSLEDVKFHSNDKSARCIGIDTGCCFGGRLTAMIFEPEKVDGYFVQVEAHTQHHNYIIAKTI